MKSYHYCVINNHLKSITKGDSSYLYSGGSRLHSRHGRQPSSLKLYVLSTAHPDNSRESVLKLASAFPFNIFFPMIGHKVYQSYEVQFWSV
jgi:hypothetical protein